MQDYYDAELSVRKILGQIIGISPAMVRVRRSVRKVAKTDEDVLLYGEAGVGKRFLAHKIHLLSVRCKAPFFELDCGVYANGGLNGHKNGNTAAAMQVLPPPAEFPGYVVNCFEKARRGTLLISGFERLSLASQSRLLSLLHQQKKAGREERDRSVRIVATSEIEPQRLAEGDRVRSKLYLHLSRVMIGVPSLRSRKQDIPFLFEHFLRMFEREYTARLQEKGLSEDLYHSLMSYDWKGNVEELKNSVRTLFLFAENGHASSAALPFLCERDPLRCLLGKTLNEATAVVEQYLLRFALGKFEGNQTKAAQHLAISEASLRYKMKKYEMGR